MFDLNAGGVGPNVRGWWGCLGSGAPGGLEGKFTFADGEMMMRKKDLTTITLINNVSIHLFFGSHSCRYVVRTVASFSV
jgi:hypothetical protein